MNDFHYTFTFHRFSFLTWPRSSPHVLPLQNIKVSLVYWPIPFITSRILFQYSYLCAAQRIACDIKLYIQYISRITLNSRFTIQISIAHKQNISFLLLDYTRLSCHTRDMSIHTHTIPKCFLPFMSLYLLFVHSEINQNLCQRTKHESVRVPGLMEIITKTLMSFVRSL